MVAAIERSLSTVPGARVVRNAKVPERIAGKRRQVDVFVEIPTGPRSLRVGVEVRDRSSAQNIEDIEQSITKLKKLDVDCGVIVSRSGFTSEATIEAARQGVELRTVEAMELPDWWLATSMSLELRRVELVRWKVNFLTHELPAVQELLAGTNGLQIDVHQADRATRTLHDLVALAGLDAINRPNQAALPEGSTFAVRIHFERDMSVTCARGPLPLPREVLAIYRVHHQFERVELGAFSAGSDVDVMSGVSASLGKQFTVVATLLPDDFRKLDFAVVDSTPPTTDVNRRRTSRDE